MTELERIAALTLDEVFINILYRLVDFSTIPRDEVNYMVSEDVTLSMYDRVALHSSLTKPTLTAMDSDLVVYKQELTDIENARLAEIVRQNDLKARWKGIYDRDNGMPAFYSLIPDRPNHAVYLRDDILREQDHALAESRMQAIEAADVIVVKDKNAIAYKANRRKAYASFQDQFDMQYKDLINSTSIWRSHIAKVKSDHPKP